MVRLYVLLWCLSVLPVLVVPIVLLVTVGDTRPSCGREGKGDLGRNKNGWKDDIEIDCKQDGTVYTEFAWLRIGTSGGLL
jgi:hypothetical protein